MIILYLQQFQGLLQQFLKLFFTVLLIMDPIGILPQFLAITGEYDAHTRRTIIRHSVIIAGLVLLIFVIFGRVILLFFGITPGAFYISGGILFFIISFEMIQSKPRARTTPASSIDPSDSKMIAVFPIAIPLIAGPGMITTIMLNVSESNFTIVSLCILLAAIILGLLIEYAALRAGSLILKLIGTTGMFVVEKIMGLILSGLSIQLIYDGLVKLGITAG
jgi:multiple antibiotic resistance protein